MLPNFDVIDQQVTQMLELPTPPPLDEVSMYYNRALEDPLTEDAPLLTAIRDYLFDRYGVLTPAVSAMLTQLIHDDHGVWWFKYDIQHVDRTIYAASDNLRMLIEYACTTMAQDSPDCMEWDDIFVFIASKHYTAHFPGYGQVYNVEAQPPEFQQAIEGEWVCDGRDIIRWMRAITSAKTTVEPTCTEVCDGL